MESSVRVEFSREGAASSVFLSYRYYLLSVLCSGNMDVNVNSWQSDVSHSSLLTFADDVLFLSLIAIHASCRISVAPSK